MTYETNVIQYISFIYFLLSLIKMFHFSVDSRNYNGSKQGKLDYPQVLGRPFSIQGYTINYEIFKMCECI